MQQRSWTWRIADGLLYVGLGIIAMSTPIDNTIALASALAAILLCAGLFSLIEGLQTFRDAGGPLRLMEASVPIVVGLALWRFPQGGIAGIAISLAVYFWLSALARASEGFLLQRYHGWQWEVTSAVAAFVLGGIAFTLNEVSSLAVPAVLLATDLVLEGVGRILFALLARLGASMHPTQQEREPPIAA